MIHIDNDSNTSKTSDMEVRKVILVILLISNTNSNTSLYTNNSNRPSVERQRRGGGLPARGPAGARAAHDGSLLLVLSLTLVLLLL